MRVLAEALSIAESTRSRKAKVEALGGALRAVADTDRARLAFAARLLTGTMLPIVEERTLGVGGVLVFEAACEATGVTAAELGTAARTKGDLGTAVGEAIGRALERAASREPSTAGADGGARADRRQAHGGLSLAEAETLGTYLVETGVRAEKLSALTDAFRAASPLEGRYLTRALLGEMRVGAAEGIVVDAIAYGASAKAEEVRVAAGLVTDVGVLAELAFDERLADARIEPGRPLGFMLATPIETARGVDLSLPHSVEDKIDGIRAQVHVGPNDVHLFARGKGPVTKAFPDVVEPLRAALAAGLPTAIVDAELVVVANGGRPRPFSAIQPRLKKTEPDADLLRENPVHCLAYDLLYEGDASLVDLPFAERRARLEQWAAKAPAPVFVHPSHLLENAADPATLDHAFEAARARGFEGLVLKRRDARYAAGVRGFSWLKVKRAFATLDVVIVAAERGHGKRAGVLSDYTFAIVHEGNLETVGKAYSGLTDAEIAAMTEKLESLALAPETHGYLRVRPEIVLEVAFDGLQKSKRHSSGFALRFPRIARIRDDKRPEQADTLATVEALWERQVASGHREELVENAAEEAAASAPRDTSAKSTAKPKSRGRRSGRKPDVRAKSKQLKLFDDD